MLRITTREFGIDLQLERLSENREVFAAKAADGKEYLLSVARTGTVAYDMLEKITAYFNEMNQGKGCVRKCLYLG